MLKKNELMNELLFCMELMNKLIEYANREYSESIYYSNKTVILNDIVRLRRELMTISHKLKGDI